MHRDTNSILIHKKPIGWYIDKLKNNEYFSQGMYGDGEWIAICHEKVNGANAEDTIYTKELCDELEESVKVKPKDFLFSIPDVLLDARLSGIGEKRITNHFNGEAYEKDMWDAEMKTGGLLPFIKQLQKMNVIIISNKHLRRLDFLNYDKFIEIPYPNCYDEIDRVVKEAQDYGKSGVYLISAGLPAALIAQKLHGTIPNSFFLDLGSIWDAFVGIGAQRGWRSEMYQDEDKYNQWLKLYEDAGVRHNRPLYYFANQEGERIRCGGGA